MEVLHEKKLANELTLTVFDASKAIAGDRWYVKVVCEGKIPVPDAFWDNVKDVDQELIEAVKEKMAGILVFSSFKERNFVDEALWEEVRNGLVSQVENNMSRYLGSPQFPEKLFAKKFAELREICQVEAQYAKLPVQQDDEDDGPADFSACFKDG